MMRFRLKIDPPTATAQMHKVGIRNGRPYFYDPPSVMQAKSKIFGALQQYIPEEPLKGPLYFAVSWNFLTKDANKVHGSWRDTKPDTDNLQKLLKDCMTQAGFWEDDAQVVFENVQKIWVKHHPGVYISLMTVNEYEEMLWRNLNEAEAGV